MIASAYGLPLRGMQLDLFVALPPTAAVPLSAVRCAVSESANLHAAGLAFTLFEIRYLVCAGAVTPGAVLLNS